MSIFVGTILRIIGGFKKNFWKEYIVRRVKSIANRHKPNIGLT